MRSVLRHRLLRYSLILFTALDLLGLSAFLFHQWFGVETPQVWVLAGVLTLSATPVLVHLVDTVLAAAAAVETIPFMGEKIPGAGQ